MELLHKTNYAIKSESDFIRNICVDYLKHLNNSNGISEGASLFGTCFVVSPIENPTTSKIVISPTPRVNDRAFKQLNLDEELVEFCVAIYRLQWSPDHIKYIRHKAKDLEADVTYFLVSVLAGYKSIDTDLIDKVFAQSYLGNHSANERYTALIGFISTPNETLLYRLLRVFPQDNYQTLINCITALVNEPPKWVEYQFKSTLESVSFIKNLMRLSTILLRAKSRAQFIAFSLKEIVYGD